MRVEKAPYSLKKGIQIIQKGQAKKKASAFFLGYGISRIERIKVKKL